MPIALVTGASRGIGAATARLAAARGYQVAVNYRSDGEAAARVVREIERAGGRALAVRADVSQEGEVLRLFEAVDRELGHVDALVNNAGILERQTALLGIDARRFLLAHPFFAQRLVDFRFFYGAVFFARHTSPFQSIKNPQEQLSSLAA